MVSSILLSLNTASCPSICRVHVTSSRPLVKHGLARSLLCSLHSY